MELYWHKRSNKYFKYGYNADTWKVIGYYNSLNGVGQIIGAGLSGFIAYDISYSFDFILSAIIVLSGLIIIYIQNHQIFSILKKWLKLNSEYV
jgi:hypothetical protein